MCSMLRSVDKREWEWKLWSRKVTVVVIARALQWGRPAAGAQACVLIDKPVYCCRCLTYAMKM